MPREKATEDNDTILDRSGEATLSFLIKDEIIRNLWGSAKISEEESNYK